MDTLAKGLQQSKKELGKKGGSPIGAEDAKEIETLKAQLAELQAEKEHWLTEKVYTVQKIISVEPLDYKKTKQRLRELEQENRALQNVMRYGRIASIADDIEEFQDVAKTYLRKIAKGMLYYPAGAEERRSLLGLLEYLSFLQGELRTMLIVDEEGETIVGKRRKEAK